MSIVDGSVQVATGFLDALKREPLSLALVAMNLALLVFFYFILSAVSQQREREVGLIFDDKKAIQDLLSKCVVPQRSAVQKVLEWTGYSFPDPTHP